MPLLTFIAISAVRQGAWEFLTKSLVYYYCVGLSRTHLFCFYSSQRGPDHHGPQCTDWTGLGSPRSIRNVPTDKYPGVETKPPEKTKTAQTDNS